MTESLDPIGAAVLGLETVATVPDLASLVRRAAAGRPRAWQLPAIVASAFGRPAAESRMACVALACLQVGIVLVDDLLDDDPRGAHLTLGVGRTANLALACDAASLEALGRAFPDGLRLTRALAAVSDTCAQVALGQTLDTQPVVDETAYWRVVASKSAAFFGLAFTLGALSAGADAATTARLTHLGGLYGEMVQIHDDLRDSLTTPASPDWVQARTPLPILYATIVPHPEREAFRHLRERVIAQGPEAADALDEAQAILRRCGAISYGLDQVLRRDRQARSWMADPTLRAPEDLRALFDEIVAPVQALVRVEPAHPTSGAT